MARSILRPLVSLAVLGALPVPFAAAQTADAPASDQSADAKPDQTYAVHGQATLVVQGVKGFASPYTGDNSLHPHDTEETVDATLYLGVRPWKGAELWVNPEIDQGFGLSNTLGAGGFPSAEAYKVGKDNPYFKLQRVFLRQTIALGGKAVTLDAAANQLRTTTTANRIVITAGKMGVGDVFDTNAYAHDPRGDFLNWSLVDTGSFDYAANAWATPMARRSNGIRATGRCAAGSTPSPSSPTARSWAPICARTRSSPKSSTATRCLASPARCA
jgi:high affinity Mn2+ porin